MHSDAQLGPVPSAGYHLETQCTSTLTKSTSLERYYQPSPKFSSIIQAEADRVYRLCLETIPFIRLARDLARAYHVDDLYLQRQTNQSRIAAIGTNAIPALDGQWPAMLSQHHRLVDLGLHSSAVDSSGGLALAASLSRLELEFIPALRRTFSSEISTNFDVQYYVAMAVYVLSNGFVDKRQYDYDSIYDIMEFLFGRVPRTSLVTFLRRDFSSMRAAWEYLALRIIYARHNNRLKRPFKSLIELGIDYDWIDSRWMGNNFLYFAASMDCVDIIQTLLTKGCRPDTEVPWPFSHGERYVSAIVAALNNGNLECARLLIEHCDVNRIMQNRIHYGYVISMTNFSVFIESYRNDNEIYS